MEYRILTVDDSSIIRSVIKKALDITGLQITAIYEGVNGLDAIEILKNKPVDIIFTDLHMPQMGGVELIETVRNSPEWKHLPIVVISAERDTSQHENLKRLNINAIITKPFKPEMLKQVILDLSQEQSSAAEGCSNAA